MLRVSWFKNRRLFQFLTAFFSNFQLLNFLTVKLYTGKLKFVPFPIMNCYACPASVFACPIGTLSHFLVLSKVPFFVVGIISAVASTFGRWICGWVCPFGLLQDLLFKIPSMKLKLPDKLSYLRYVSLVLLVVVLPFFFKEHYFCMLCPTGTLEAGLYWVAASGMILRMAGGFFLFKVAIASSFLYLSIFVKRPFCRFLCPLGAFFSLFNKLSIVDFEVKEKDCIECNLCKKACPVDYPIYRSPNSPNCLRCLNCVRVCSAVKVKSNINLLK